MLGSQRIGGIALQPGQDGIAGLAVGPAQVVVSHRLGHGLDACRVGHGLDEPGGFGQLVRGGDGSTELALDPPGHRLHIGEQPLGRRLLRIDRVGEDAADLGNAVARHRRGHVHLGVGESVLDQQLAQMIGRGLLLLSTEFVDLVEHDDHVRTVLRQFGQVLRVEREVRVLLRIDDPEDHIDEPDEAIRFDPVRHGRRIVVGQIQQDQTVESALIVTVERGLAPGATALGNVQPVEEVGSARAPDACGRSGGRGTTDADAGDLESGHGVEQRGFARAGRTGEGDDGEILAQAQPILGAFKQMLGILADLGAELVGAQGQRMPDRLGESSDLGLCRTVHNATSSRSPEERSAPACRAGTADSLRALSKGTRQEPTIPEAEVRNRSRTEAMRLTASCSPKIVPARLRATLASLRTPASAPRACLGSQKAAYSMTAQTPPTPNERILALDFLP